MIFEFSLPWYTLLSSVSESFNAYFFSQNAPFRLPAQVKARLAAKAADDAAFRDAMQTTPRGLKCVVVTNNSLPSHFQASEAS